MNVNAVVYASQACARLWLKTKYPGVIINIASEAGEAGGSVAQSSYAASKAAVLSLTQSWAKGTRTNSLSNHSSAEHSPQSSARTASAW